MEEPGPEPEHRTGQEDENQSLEGYPPLGPGKNPDSYLEKKKTGLPVIRPFFTRTQLRDSKT